jgi:hypothetical protein
MAWEKGPYQQDSAFQQSLKNFGSNLVGYTPSARFVSGGRVLVSINGIPAPRLSSISWKINTDQRPNREIDNHFPHEFVPNNIDVSGSYSEYREPFRGATNAFHQASALSFMWHPYISIEVRDNLTDALLFYAGKAVIFDRSESVTTEGLVMTSVQWRAISWKDEREPTIPQENAGDVAQTAQNPIAQGIDAIGSAFGVKNVSGTIGGFVKKIF